MVEIDWLSIQEVKLKEVIQHLSDEEFAQEYDSFIRSYNFASDFFTSNGFISGYLDYMYNIFNEEVGKRFLYLHGLA